MKIAFSICLILAGASAVSAQATLYGHLKDDNILSALLNIYPAPSGRECIDYLDRFLATGLKDFDELGQLDLCLGYLFESKTQDQDVAKDQYLREILNYLKTNSYLKELYQQTEINSLRTESKQCIVDLMLGSVPLKKLNSGLACTDDWFYLLYKFSTCQGELRNKKFDDTYLNVMYKCVVERGQHCFSQQVALVEQAIHTNYTNNPFDADYWELQKEEVGGRYYPLNIGKVLLAISGRETEINLREVSRIVGGSASGDLNYQGKLLTNMAKYARLESKSTGVQRYDQIVYNLCSFLMKRNDGNSFNFNNPFIKMIFMYQKPEVFDIFHYDFLERVLRHHDIGPLYLSVAGCDIFKYTAGQVIGRYSDNSLAYNVVFTQNANKILQWPNVNYY